MSATKAEYIAASEAVWIRKFISGLGIVPTINEPIKMSCDNSAALLIANEPGVQKGARHYHRRYHYVRGCIKLGEINLLKVHTDDNLVDPFTKDLPKRKLTQHARSIGLRLAMDNGAVLKSKKLGFPVSRVPRPRRLEQVMVEIVVMLNSISLVNEVKSGAFVALTLCTSTVLGPDQFRGCKMIETTHQAGCQALAFGIRTIPVGQSFHVSSFSYAKSLSSHVLMWDPACFSGRGLAWAIIVSGPWACPRHDVNTCIALMKWTAGMTPPTVASFPVLENRRGRHTDTDLRDDFPTNYSENDAAHFAEFVVPLRSPPRHLLYMCGLTTACRHLELAYNIKDQDRNDIYMDTFLKLPVWTGTTASKGYPIPNNKRPKTRTTLPLAHRLSVPGREVRKLLERKGRFARIRRRIIRVQRGLSPTPLHHAGSENIVEPVTRALNDTTGHAANVEREHTASDGMLSILSIWACKELISHLAIPAKEEFLGNFTNVEVVSRAYQSLDQCVLSQGELLKRHEQLNHDYVDLCNRSDAHLMEVDQLRMDLQREMHAYSGLSKELSLLVADHFRCSDRERELLDSLCFTAGWLGVLSLDKTEDQIDSFLSETRDLDIKGSKSWEVDDLIKVSPDVPPSPSKDGGGDSGADIDDAAQQPPPQI
ncbi:hypothetical protein Tco_0966634 [Tanacetum coccineum]